MLHLISSPRSSSFNLSSAVWEPLFPFLFVRSPRPFYRGCFYHWVSPSSAQTFDPLDPANYHLLYKAWFLLKWIKFLVSQEIHVSVEALKFIQSEPEHIFPHSLKFLLQTKTSMRYVDECSQPSRLERSSWLKKFNWTFIHGLPRKSSWIFFFKPGVLHAALNQPWTQLSWVPGLLDPQLALFLPISYYRHYRYCVVFQQLSAATFTAAIKRISLRQLCTRSESNSFFTPWDKTKALLLENWVKIIS